MKALHLIITFSLLLAACAEPERNPMPELTVTPLATSQTGNTYYVRPEGSDANNGLTPESAFKTLQHAHDITKPGDTVLVMDGTYTESSGEGVLVITRSGSAKAYITYKAYPGQHPKLHAVTAWNHILVAGAAYIKIEGLEVEGNNANITVEKANEIYEYMVKANKENTVDWARLASTNTNGIFIRSDDNGHIPHHIEVRNNIVHDCPGSGIGTSDADYITIEDNLVFHNAYYAVFATSGIGLFMARDIDTNTGVKNMIRRNRVYGNETRVKWYVTEDWSDGNGIIIDSFLDEDKIGGAYKGRTLVTNNISAGNGGSGIHCFNSANVDIINNTAYKNSKNPNLSWGSIFSNQCANVNILNNILFARLGKPTNTNYGNTNTRYDYNIYYNGLAPEILGDHDLRLNPGFVRGDENLAEADFRLAVDSYAIDHGTFELAPGDDIDGTTRPQGKSIDIGAYEFPGDTSPRLIPTVVPTATPTPLAIDSTIPAVNAAPLLNGKLDPAWPEASQDIRTNLLGEKTSATDIAGNWRATWDTNALYVFVQVNDDKLINDSKDTWEDDGVEIYIDSGNERAASYTAKDFTYRFRWNDPRVVELYSSSTAGIQFVEKQTANGYNLEVSIPWQTLGVSPSNGKLLGFDVHINDDDNGGARDNKIAWFGSKDNAWNTPSSFGVVQLAGNSSAAINTPMPATPTNSAPPELKVYLQQGDPSSNAVVDSGFATAFRYEIANEGQFPVSQVSLRIYFTVDDGLSAEDYSLTSWWDETNSAAISGPTQAQGKVYFFTISYGNKTLLAGNSWHFAAYFQVNGAQDSANDWYHQPYGMGQLPAELSITKNIPLYLGQTLVWGKEP